MSPGQISQFAFSPGLQGQSLQMCAHEKKKGGAVLGARLHLCEKCGVPPRLILAQNIKL